MEMSTRPQKEPDSSNPNGPIRPWPVLLLSTVCSALAVSAAGVFCAILYPILTELQSERVRADDGTEDNVLGYGSILVLSVIAGCICCAFTWTLTYLDSYTPGTISLPNFRHVPGQSFHLGYGMSVLNGIMAMLTVFWSLT